MDTPQLAELAKPLFSNIYQVRVRQIDSVPLNEISRFGTRTSGNRQWDVAAQNAPIVVYWTIDTMTKYVAEDVPFALVDQDDARRIHNIIDTYLDAIISACALSLNVRLPPLEDIDLLNTLSEMLYPHALDAKAYEEWKNPVHALTSPVSPVGLLQKAKAQTFGGGRAPYRRDFRAELAPLYAQRGV